MVGVLCSVGYTGLICGNIPQLSAVGLWYVAQVRISLNSGILWTLGWNYQNSGLVTWQGMLTWQGTLIWQWSQNKQWIKALWTQIPSLKSKSHECSIGDFRENRMDWDHLIGCKPDLSGTPSLLSWLIFLALIWCNPSTIFRLISITASIIRFISAIFPIL